VYIKYRFTSLYLMSSENKSRRACFIYWLIQVTACSCQERIWKVFNIRINEHGFDESCHCIRVRAAVVEYVGVK